MLTTKDKIEQFKRECRSMDYYHKCVQELNDKIEELDVKLTGLASTNSDQPKCENAKDPYKDRKPALIVEQDEYIKERNKYISRINDVNSKLMKIADENDRMFITELYINREYYKNVVNKSNYSDKSAFYRHINKVIAKIV
ncbi:MAG: hypothetical protein U0N20_01910 [Clostridium sp.]